MKTQMTLFLFLFISVALSAQKIAVAGSGNPNISIIDQSSGQVEWTHSLEPGEECNSVAVTPEGNILYSYSKGAKLITRDHTVLWDIKGGENSEIQSASLLPDGNYLLGICGNPARILEVDPKGSILKQIQIDLDIENPHSQFRQIRKLNNGNYLIPVLAKQKVIEVDTSGTVVKELPVDAGAFSVALLDQGYLLLPCGDQHRFIIVDGSTGKLRLEVQDKDVKGATLLFVAEILLLPNGNLLICNWDGHSKGDTTDVPQLIELNTYKEAVWTFTDKENVGKVSAAFYIP